MGKLVSFTMPGYEIWFWSDDHDPPHFHVKRRGEWELKVSFLKSRDEMFELKWAKKTPKASVLKEIFEKVKENRELLLLECTSEAQP